MYSRIETDAEAIFLPDEWCSDVSKLLHSLYNEELAQNEMTLEVYGLTYPQEVVLIVSILNAADETAKPITYMASAPLTEAADPKMVLDVLVDSSGGFLDHILGDLESVEYHAVWTEAKIKDLEFHYLISRENIALSLEATRLLREH